jgi:aminoglycoside phosphotransferase family enzyme
MSSLNPGGHLPPGLLLFVDDGPHMFACQSFEDMLGMIDGVDDLQFL